MGQGPGTKTNFGDTENMSIGQLTYQRLKQLEGRANAMGFMFAYGQWRRDGDADVIALKPKDDMLPIYSRDAELCVGDIDRICAFLTGIEFERDYIKMLRVTTDAKIARKEQDVRNKQLADKLKA
jgi:hypothetical protein